MWCDFLVINLTRKCVKVNSWCKYFSGIKNLTKKLGFDKDDLLILWTMKSQANQDLTIESPLSSIQLEELINSDYELVIYNDDVNTFDYVIESIVDICKHNLLQAEQCTWIIHHKGKCSVKRGPLDKLRPMCEAFLDRNISAKLEC